MVADMEVDKVADKKRRRKSADDRVFHKNMFFEQKNYCNPPRISLGVRLMGSKRIFDFLKILPKVQQTQMVAGENWQNMVKL